MGGLTVENLMLFSMCAPFVAALASFARPFRARFSLALAAVACAPLSALALWVALAGTPDGTVRLDWILTGLSFGVDELSGVFVVIAAVLWTASALYCRGYFSGKNPPERFAFFYFAAMGGNVGLLFAQDAVAFYLFFAVMTFSAYGLVVHYRDPGAVRAARVYMAMAVIGETLLVAALLLIASSATGLDFPSVKEAVAVHPAKEMLVGLIIAAYAVKAGLVPLHFWLPLAHPAAPVPASAVLSGVVIKAGLIGWLRFLPMGLVPFPGWGGALIAAGLFSAFYAVVAGVTRKEPKAVLAYSSVSQMGLVALALGLSLGSAGSGRAGLAALLLISLHHSLAKGALFLGTGIVTEKRSALVLLGLALPALSLAAAPFTSGAAAKAAIKGLAHAGQAPPPFYADWLLVATSVATAIIMARFIHVSWSAIGASGHGQDWPGPLPSISWAAVTAASVILFRFVSIPGVPEGMAKGPYYGRVISAAWPVVAGGAAYFALETVRRRTAFVRIPPVSPGDIIVPLGRLLDGARVAWRWAGSALGVLQGIRPDGSGDLAARLIASGEKALARGRLPWLLVLLLAALLLLLTVTPD